MIDGTPARLVTLISMMSVSQFLRRVFLEVDAGGDAERHRDERGHQHDQRRADPGRQDAGLRRRGATGSW